MAFAPLKKTQASKTAAASRIAVRSPLKRSIDPDTTVEVKPFDLALPSKHAISIPSRYKDIPPRYQGLDHTKGKGSKSLPLRKVIGATNIPESSSAAHEVKIPHDPAQRKTASDSIETQKDLLATRILQRSWTCQQGQESLVQLQRSAESRLTKTWLRVRQAGLESEMRLQLSQMTTDAIELNSLSIQDILIIEDLVTRIDELKKQTSKLDLSLDEWSTDPLEPISRRWQSDARQIVQQCLSSRLVCSAIWSQRSETKDGGVVAKLLSALTKRLEQIQTEVELALRIASGTRAQYKERIAQEFDSVKACTFQADRRFLMSSFGTQIDDQGCATDPLFW